MVQNSEENIIVCFGGLSVQFIPACLHTSCTRDGEERIIHNHYFI